MEHTHNKVIKDTHLKKNGLCELEVLVVNQSWVFRGRVECWFEVRISLSRPRQLPGSARAIACLGIQHQICVRVLEVARVGDTHTHTHQELGAVHRACHQQWQEQLSYLSEPQHAHL